MTLLSVNLNKIALLRNSRGRNYPNVVDFAQQLIALGVRGITVHPREDERHITRQDAYDLGELLATKSQVEYNIEGYPSQDFLNLVHDIKPNQCTLVPDLPGQLTSDHGWDMPQHLTRLTPICHQLAQAGIRPALFMDPDTAQIQQVPKSGAQRIELYTESYAQSYGTPQQAKVLKNYQQAALSAQQLGLGVNAGHDLDINNLADFLTIPNILEVSIGHSLTIECIQQGMVSVIRDYLAICKR